MAVTLRSRCRWTDSSRARTRRSRIRSARRRRVTSGRSRHASREAHGKAGGEPGADSDVIQEKLSRSGATIMGRRMFSGGSPARGRRPERQRLVGRRAAVRPRPPRAHPPRPRAARTLGGTTFTFVTDGVEAASSRPAPCGRQGRLVAGGAQRRAAVPRRRAPRGDADPRRAAVPRRRRAAVRDAWGSWSSTGRSRRRRHPPALPRREVA